MVNITLAPGAAREEVAQYMGRVFPRAKWGMEGWRRLMSGRWDMPEDPCAVVIRDGDALVGVLGLIHARRHTPRGVRHVISMTSWYVLPDYRGQRLGVELMRRAAAIPDATVTNLTSSANALGAVDHAGMVVLDDTRCVWQARAVSGARLELVEAPLSAPDLDPVEAQVIADHAGLGLRSCLVRTEEGPLVVVCSVKQKHDAYVTHETMHLSDPALFSRHARAVADALLPEAGAVLSVDSRFVLGGAVPDRTEAISVPRFFSPGHMEPVEVDHLYSEVVLLGMKMY